MKPDPHPPAQNPGEQSGRPRLSARILQLVRSVPERNAIVSGEVDAVLDPVARRFFLLPEAQKAQHEHHARIHGLLALAADWVWEQDENHCFVSVSSVRSVDSAMVTPDLLGKRVWDLPFSSERASDLLRHRQQLEWRAHFRDVELTWEHQNGETQHLSMSGEPVFDSQDRYLGYRGTMVDITQRKMFEAMARKSSDEPAEWSFEMPLASLPEPGSSAAGSEAATNLLLAALPTQDARDFAANLELVPLVNGQVLCERGDRIRHVYFPNDCLISLLIVLKDQHALEVGLVGREGMVGISVAVGIDVTSAHALVRSEGTAVRMDATRFVEMFESSPLFRRRVLVFADVKMRQARRTAACGRFHLAEARLARWLLMAHDRLEADRIVLTHAALAKALGLQRAVVTIAASALKKQGLIRVERGSISVNDLQGLEAIACECFEPVDEPPTHQAAS